MAYGHKYNITFKNRIQNDTYRAEIWLKDYVGGVKELYGAETPFTSRWNNNNLFEPIQGLEITLSFLSKPSDNSYNVSSSSV